MAELVGGALLSGFLDVLFDRLATQEVLNFFRVKKIFAKLLDELKVRLLSANKLLNDAEVKQLTDENVKKWLDELKEVLYEADHVLDKINTEALRRKVEGGDQSVSKASKFLDSISTFFSTFENTVKSEMEEILHKLDLVLRQNEELGLREDVHQNRPQRLPAPLVDACDVFGRDAEKEAIIELLLSAHSGGPKISVIPIVGMGGIGKTTLAQLVYDDSRVQDHFTLKVWVTVSEEFNVLEITKAIFERTTGRKSKAKDLYQLQSELRNEIMGKRFLFVHDDVWNENYELWDTLRSPFNYGVDGSKIIVTTRSEVVARKMGTVPTYYLQMISDNDGWKLFLSHVFDDVGSRVHPDLQEIGKEIVKKCKGLPLAIKSIAGVLRSLKNQEEWKGILESDVWELQFQESQKSKMLPALWLSYQFLPSQLKRCFAYFSIFPKDYEFREHDKEIIVMLWMAEGLVQPERGKRVEDVGKEYLDSLISRSFFQRSSSYGKPTLHMHDLVHDLAMRVSGECWLALDGCTYSDDVTSRTSHLSYRRTSKVMMKLWGLSKTKRLRTLLALPLSYDYGGESILLSNLLEPLLGAGGCLKVLSLSQSHITELPSSIGDLKHLRYLDLSYTNIEELPSSICKLYNLQTLLLSNCKMLTQLPSNMCRLINLRHLVIRDTSLNEMPPHMWKLRNLQTLSDFVLGENCGSRIKELGSLQFLHGSLRISGLENVLDVRDVFKANMKSKEHLTELILKWEYGRLIDASTKEREVLDALEPHTKLKKLMLEGYRGTMFPGWVGHPSFSDMVEVFLIECKNCCLLPSLGQLSSLKMLEIRSMDGLESVGDEFYGTNSFPSLESLGIAYMHSMEKWSFPQVNQEGGVFPCLKDIDIRSCGKLNVGLLASCFPSLKRMKISSCEAMVSVVPTSQLEIDSAYSSLESIHLRGCPRLESFSRVGFPSNLKVLAISDCPKLIANFWNWDPQRLSSLQSLLLSDYEFEEAMDSYPEEGLLPSALTSLKIWSFRNLKALNGKSFQHLTSLQRLEILDCRELQCLPEEMLPLSLTHLRIADCPLLNQRCQRQTGDDWPTIQHIPNIFIDNDGI